MPGVAILGGGNVGATTAFFMAEKGIHDVVLYDIQAGIPAGKALDIMEAAPLRKYRGRIRGQDSLESLRNADIVVLAAGRPRQPAMNREALFEANCALIESLASEIPQLSPCCNVIVATEPVDRMTHRFVCASGLPPRQVMGLGCCLDTVRMRHAIAREMGVTVDNVSALVIGLHTKTMLLLPEYSNVGGVPVGELLAPEAILRLENEVREAGDVIVEKAKRASSHYAPAALIAELAESMLLDARRVFSVSVELEGQYGLTGIALSLPAVIGKEGVVKVLEPMLSDAQRKQLGDSVQPMEGGQYA